MSEVLGIDVSEGVLTLTMKRAERRNAIDDELRHALLAGLDSARETGARAVLLNAEGSAFCAGADVSDPPRGFRAGNHMLVSTHRLIERLLDYPLPVVAAVQGNCAGYGISLALATDFCVAAHDARFLPAFTTLGLAPDGAIAATVTRAVGTVRARRILLLGEAFTGREAAEMSLIHASYEPEALPEAARALAVRLAQGATVAYGLTKAMILRASQIDIPALLREERLSQGVLTVTDDHHEAISAFRERRSATFEGH